jgi:hypothetical protein
MGHLLTSRAPFPFSPPPIGEAGKAGKWEHARNVPKRGNRDERECAYLLASRGVHRA